MTLIFNKKSETKKRKNLRNNQTQAEKLLWYKLQNKQLNGHKFHRQYSVNCFILDFYCPKAKLGIEIDGDSHYNADAVRHDFSRQEFIESLGIKILRFTNTEIYNSRDEVLLKILKFLPPLPPPSKGGEEEQTLSGGE